MEDEKPTVAADAEPCRGFDRLGVALAAMLRATRALQQSNARVLDAAAELDVASQRFLAALTPLAPMSRV